MKIAVLYTCVPHSPHKQDLAARFVATYNAFPPGVPHDTIVCCNGGKLDLETELIFASLNPQFFPNNNSGWDVGAYIAAAHRAVPDYHMVVCCGESVYFTRSGWLDRILHCWNEFGPGMYGLFSSHNVRAHLNTTAFATDPALLRAYPRTIVSRQDRYEFEHGGGAFWKWVNGQGKPARFITWDGCWPPLEWRVAPNILWRGDQSNLLARCNHTDRYDQQHPAVRIHWQMKADQQFQ